MKKVRIRLLPMILFLLALICFACGANAVESTCPATVSVMATLGRGETEAIVYRDADQAVRLGTLKKGVECQVVGVRGNYYRIVFDGAEGYVPRNKLKVKGVERDTAFSGNAVADLALEQYLFYKPSQAKTMPVHGTVRTEEPLDTLFFVLWDERLQQVEQVVVEEVKTPAASLDIQDACAAIRFPSVTAGRKTLLIQGAANGRVVNLYRAPVYVCGQFKAIRNINDQCKFSAGRNQDQGGRSWTPSSAQEVLTVTLPQDGSASLMTLEWQRPAEAFTVVCLDADQQTISAETRTTGFYADAVPLPPEARQVQLSLADEGNWVRSLCVYDENHPDNAVQQWQPLPEKLDLMAFSPHQDDELLFLGGTIPYACQKGAEVGVVYMTNCGRSRYAEALDGLWTAGLRNHPIFLNWKDQWGTYVQRALDTWSLNGVDPQKEVVRLIRKYKPEVVVGTDLEGEYGHAQHRLTVMLVTGAIPLAMDESYDIESVQEYGVWEVKKVYLHLYDENPIEMDWDQPFSPDSPISPIFLAKEAYDKHRSQQKEFNMNRKERIYNNRLFGLYYTAVGPDEAKNDFFEHIELH
ncbi:MAG: PIG-L family deacetylase [Clostridia bacterium]|nr:PIG-L family deacetylase [Clostridia bacterium]